MSRSLAAIVVAEALLIAVPAYLLATGKGGARGDRPRAERSASGIDSPETPASGPGATATSPRVPTLDVGR